MLSRAENRASRSRHAEPRREPSQPLYLAILTAEPAATLSRAESRASRYTEPR